MAAVEKTLAALEAWRVRGSTCPRSGSPSDGSTVGGAAQT